MDDIKRMYRVAAVLELFGEDDDAKIVRDAADELQNRRAAIVRERKRADKLEAQLAAARTRADRLTKTLWDRVYVYARREGFVASAGEIADAAVSAAVSAAFAAPAEKQGEA